jgi:hypothetical protein
MQEETTVRFERYLDGRAALNARAVIEAAPPEAELVVDFSRVRDAEYMALATVVVAIAGRRGRPIVLRGLCDHHLRLLRYLGIDVDRLARREGAARAERTEPAVPAAVAQEADRSQGATS